MEDDLKYDMDIGVTLCEVMPNGQFFHLSYFVVPGHLMI